MYTQFKRLAQFYKRYRLQETVTHIRMHTYHSFVRYTPPLKINMYNPTTAVGAA